MKRQIWELSTDNEFEKFYKANLEIIVRHIYHKSYGCDLNGNSPEDIAQEVFILAAKNWDKLRGNDMALRWLYQTANYKMRELGRKQATHPTISFDEEELEQELAEETEEYAMSELELSVLKIVPRKEWLLLNQYYVQGKSIKELAEVEGITPNNMRVRIARMKKKLRKALKD